MKDDLKLSPLRIYTIPAYPTKKEVQDKPAILKLVPKRWDAKPAVCAALSATLMTGLAGCVGVNFQSSGSLSESGNSERLPSSANSVPVFEHGSGRGSYGCVMVAPPVFLSEEEALQVIREEAEAKGIHFDGTKTVKGNQFPATNIYYGDQTEPGTWEGSLDLDGYDPALNIGFEFVSTQDVVDWSKEGDVWSSVESYDMKGTAERLADVLENTAVFYDPASDPEAFDRHQIENGDYETYYKKYETEQKAKMIEQLREQVCDFLAWLAAEGVI